MFCRNCGKEIHQQAVACPGCGVPPLVENKFCNNCGTATEANQVLCTKCGASLCRLPVAGDKSKVAAGLLAILLGWLGIHKFYLGYNKEGLVMLLVSVLGGIVTCGGASGIMTIIGLVEGIVYLTKSDEEFTRLYVHGHTGWF